MVVWVVDVFWPPFSFFLPPFSFFVVVGGGGFSFFLPLFSFFFRWWCLMVVWVVVDGGNDGPKLPDKN